MHDRNNIYVGIGMLEDDGIGETVGKTAAGAWGKPGPCGRDTKDTGNGSTYFGGKFETKSRTLIVVVGNRVTQFIPRWREEVDGSFTFH